MIATEIARPAYDIPKATRRSDQASSEEAAVKILAHDWAGFAWEYGLKNHLRFTPYTHFYDQQFDFETQEFRMVSGDELESGVDFLERINREERGGLIFEATKALKTKFFASPPGKRFLLASPPSADFSPYGFLYFFEVEETDEGKRLRGYDFLNDATKDDLIAFYQRFGTGNIPSSEATLEEVASAVVDTELEDLGEIWWALTKSKSDSKIFGKTLEEILPLVNIGLLDRAKEKSFQEARYLHWQIKNGVDPQTIQRQMGNRLVRFVEELTGKPFDYSEIKQGRMEGRCGGVSFSSSEVPEWVQFNPMTGEFTCSLCFRSLKRKEINEHRCKC